LQQKGNHGVSDDPPKTLSSRSQTLSKLQPVEPPPERSNEGTPNVPGWLPAPATPAAAERPLSSRKRAEQQSRIVLLAPLPGERKPAIRWQACNALNVREAAIYSIISWRL
jgi:hypothetical protein